MLIITGKEIKMGTMGPKSVVMSGLNTCINWNAHFKENLNDDMIGPTSKNFTSSMKSINIINDTDLADAPGYFNHNVNEVNFDDKLHIFHSDIDELDLP